MPAKYKRCVSKVAAKGHSEKSAHAICTASNAGNIHTVRRAEARAKRREKRS